MTWWSHLWKRDARTAPHQGAQPTDGLKSLHSGTTTSKQLQGASPSLPFYTAIAPGRPGHHQGDLRLSEHLPEVAQLRERFQSELLTPPRRPGDDKPLFTTLLSGPSGIFTLGLPDTAPCLLTFSSPLRAGTYASVHAESTQLRYMLSTPREFVQMLADLKRSGVIQKFALDVCPYCLAFPAVDINPLWTAADVVNIWAIQKAGELARESVYFARAKDAFACGNFQLAKAVSLEAIQHVTAESGRLHLVLGKAALSVGDKDLLREAKAFLEFLREDQALRELCEAGQDSEIPN